MTARPQSSVSLPCESRSRNWADLAHVPRHTIPRPNRSAPLRLSPKAPARFAHDWSRNTSRFARPPRGRPCIAAPSSARPNSRPRTTSSRPCFVSASSNSSAGSPRRPRRPRPRPPTRPPRPRGQRRGKPGPRRWDDPQLPAVVEDHVLPSDQCLCSRCGQPFAAFPGTEDSQILEVEVRAHRRILRRRRYRPTCGCGAHPGVVSAPPPPRLIPKGILGVSIWVTVLLDKYLLGRFPKSGCLFRDRIPYPSDDKLDIPARLPATASQPCRYVSSPEPVLSCRPRMICSVPLASRPRPLNSSGRSDWRTTPPVSPGWRSRSTTTSVAWPT